MSSAGILSWSSAPLPESHRGGGQLNKMESGSLLAICAMCFRMSFLVMMPSSLLRRKGGENKVQGYRKGNFTGGAAQCYCGFVDESVHSRR